MSCITNYVRPYALHLHGRGWERDTRQTNSIDIMAAIETFLTIVPRQLAKGNIVELGDFGNFWLKSTFEGVETPDEVRSNQITGILPRFSPGKEFKRVLDVADFEKRPYSAD